jgi:hypothetical protein
MNGTIIADTTIQTAMTKLRFDGPDEILALTPAPAPFDAVQLKRNDGRSVLRLYPTVRCWSSATRSGAALTAPKGIRMPSR